MKSKPVFEKFEDFLDFLNANVINEEQSFGSLAELQTFLGSNGMESKGKMALNGVEEIAKKSSLGAFSKDNFNTLALTLNRLSIPDVTEITDIRVFHDDMYYKNVLGGTVVTDKGDRVNIADLFTKVNKENLNAMNKVPLVNKDKKQWGVNKEGDKEFIQGSGALRQYVLIDAPGKLDFKKYTGADPVKDSSGQYDLAKPDDKSQKKGGYYTEFLIYYPIAITQGNGETYNSTELVETVRPVAKTSTKLAPIVIQDDNVLFELNKSVLKDEGKAAILNALSGVATAKSIEITGGASKEGDVKRNEVLCKERAQAVADFLKGGAFKNAEIKVSDVADIQPANSTDPLEKWRKVTLNIDGQSLVTEKETTQEKVVRAANLTKRMDTLKFRQVSIVINSSFI